MKREIIITKDGSSSILLPEWNETYHSKFGAIQEAKHVFIKNGLDLFQSKPISILEIGFGTGLNALITLLEADNKKQVINYVGVEAYPVEINEIQLLNYAEELYASDKKELFIKMHESNWGKSNAITDFFSLTKKKQFFNEINDEDAFNLIYFDAFGFRVQPELWNEEMFEKMYQALKTGGVLVTYACRTSIKNAMLQAGFKIEKLPGAPGKREMLRAIKN